ncbi:MAG: 2'-5' RNA ligase family protein [Bryobacteraceae bacterium]
MLNMPEDGLIALVSYLPEPLTTALQNFRDVLPSAYSALPHITILPPRPLQVEIEAAMRYISDTIAPFREFAVELTELLSFPATNVLYLAVDSGSDELKQLHLALNTGDLSYREVHEFTPHVTVAGPFESTVLPGMLQQANLLWNTTDSARLFPVRELVLLWTGTSGDQWEPLTTFTLRGTTKELLATTAGNRT